MKRAQINIYSCIVRLVDYMALLSHNKLEFDFFLKYIRKGVIVYGIPTQAIRSLIVGVEPADSTTLINERIPRSKGKIL